MLTDSRAVYGRITQALHWIMAFYLIRQAVGVIAGRFNEGENFVSELMHGLHRPTGVAIMVLVVVRMIWALTQMGHRPSHPNLVGRLAVAGHGLMYALMFLLPATGILLDWGRGKRLEAYGVTLLEKGPEVDWAIAVGSTLHQPLGWLLIVLIAGHIMVAFFHQFVVRDGTMNRMIGSDR